MLYLDTGCLLKLYYPEPESATVAAAVSGGVIAFTELHELEMVTALQLKVFRGEAKPEQATSVMNLVREDFAAGKLSMEWLDWRAGLREASRMSQNHAATVGCRSLDILHCALAKTMGAGTFLSSDARQLALARAESLRALAI